MRSYPSCWNNTLAQLGFKRKRRKVSKRRDHLRRRSLFEILEQRQMLSGDSLFDLSSEETVVAAGVTPESFVVFSSEPEFFLIQPEIPADELEGLSQEELDAIEPIFSVKTIQAEAGPQAILSFNPDFKGHSPKALQKLHLELRQDGHVVDSYEILIDIAEERFREKFLADRMKAVAENVTELDSHEIANWLTETGDYSKAEADAGEVVSDIEFEYLLNFIGPLTLEKSALLNEGFTQRSDRLVKDVAPTADFLVSLARSQAEQKDVFVDHTERVRFYSELDKHTQTLKQDRLTAVTEAELHSISEREQSLRNTTLLLAKNLQSDIKSEEASVAQAARKLRDELVAISGPYETAFAGLGVDREIERKFLASGDEKSVSFVETGRYVFNEQLEIDLGEEQAMVQVTRSSRFRAAASSYILGSPAVEDGSISEASPNSNGGSSISLHVDGTPGSLQESLIKFKLADVAEFDDPTTLASAALQLFEIGAGVGNAEVYVWNGLFGGPAGSATDWDETNLNWNHVDGTLDLEGNLSEFTQLSDWAAGATTEVDVTSQLQRALLYGDANGDGQFSAAEFDGDIEAFHLAVTNWDAYVAEYGPRANSPADLLARTDGGLGDGAVDTSDISDFFRRHGFSQGDYNLDGTVQDDQDSGIDGLDWAVFNANYGLKNARFSQGDGNFDGVVGDEDFDIWFDRQGEDNLTPAEPEIVFWVRPEDSTTDIEFGSQEHVAIIGPTLVVEEQPDLALNKFSVQGNSLVVDYAVLGTDFTNVKVQIYKAGSPDTLLHETSVQSGSLGSHKVLVAANVLSSIVEGDSIYAKLVGAPSSGTQSNTANDQLDFEFSTLSTQTVNSLDDAEMDILLRDKHTLRELLDVNEALGWFDTLTFDDTSLFADGPGVITLGDHDQNGVTDELKIKQNLVIEGPGSHLLSIDARQSNRVFNISDSNTTNLLDVSISGLKAINGYVLGAGGAIANAENLTLDKVVLQNNEATSLGGGLYHNYGTLTIVASMLDNNQALHGGGVYGFFKSIGSLDVNSSTFSNNTATSVGGGFVFKNVDNGSDSSGTFVNSTFSGNTNSSYGGGLRIRGSLGADTEVTLINTTVTGNSALVAGGVFSYKEATVTLHNTIVAGNTISSSSISATDASGPIGGTAADPSANNLLGFSNSGLGISDGSNGNQTGTTSVALDARLAPLNYYGGVTPTHSLYEDSPAIDRGNDSKIVDALGNPLLVDQGGFDHFQDIVGLHNEGSDVSDIGSNEFQIAHLAASPPPGGGPTKTTLKVKNFLDNGTPGSETLRDILSLAKKTGGDVEITFDQTLFADGLPKEIKLGFDKYSDEQFDELLIDSNVTIVGPGADLLSINAQKLSRVFSVAADTTAEIRDLTITGGNANASLFDQGGGVHVAGNLTLKYVEVVNNASYRGGGIYFTGSESLGIPSLSLINSTLDNNLARFGGGLAYEGPGAEANIEIIGTTFSNNRADSKPNGKGGGLHVSATSSMLNLDVSNSTFSQNTAAMRGGGVYLAHWSVDKDVYNSVFTNVTIADNQTTDYLDQAGGGIYVSGTSNTVKLNNTIVARNTKDGTALPDDVSGSFDTAHSAHNLIGDANSAGGLQDDVNNNQVGLTTVEIGLAPLGDYGGPTKTHALLPGSDAIDGGDDQAAIDAELTTDQRGPVFFQRFVNKLDNGPLKTVDAGAYEYDSWVAYAVSPEGVLTVDNTATQIPTITLSSVGTSLSLNGFLIEEFPASSVTGIVVIGANDVDETIDLSAIAAGSLPSMTSSILIQGGSGNDTIVGSAYDDILQGGEGYDTLTGLGGNDIYAFGGEVDLGVDTIEEAVGGGSDTLDFTDLFFGAGVAVDLRNNTGVQQYINEGDRVVSVDWILSPEIENVTGTYFDDILHGDDSANQLHGGAGDDLLLGGMGIDTLHGDAGNDTLLGGADDDILHGGEGSDFLNGEQGADTLLGGSGNDELYGGDGEDNLLGEQGNDFLDGQADDDTYDGGSGHDIYAEDNDNNSPVPEVENRAPVFVWAGNPYYDLLSGTPVENERLALDVDGGDLVTFEFAAYDPDGDPVSYSYGMSDGTDAPSLNFDSSTGSFSWQPFGQSDASFPFRVTAHDTTDPDVITHVDFTVTVKPRNDAPHEISFSNCEFENGTAPGFTGFRTNSVSSCGSTVGATHAENVGDGPINDTPSYQFDVTASDDFTSNANTTISMVSGPSQSSFTGNTFSWSPSKDDMKSSHRVEFEVVDDGSPRGVESAKKHTEVVYFKHTYIESDFSNQLDFVLYNPPLIRDVAYNTSVDMQVAQILGAYEIEVVSGPQHGSLAVTGSGLNEFIYTPNPGYQGLDEFAYQVAYPFGKKVSPLEGGAYFEPLTSNVAKVSIYVGDMPTTIDGSIVPVQDAPMPIDLSDGTYSTVNPDSGSIRTFIDLGEGQVGSYRPPQAPSLVNVQSTAPTGFSESFLSGNSFGYTNISLSLQDPDEDPDFIAPEISESVRVGIGTVEAGETYSGFVPVSAVSSSSGSLPSGYYSARSMLAIVSGSPSSSYSSIVPFEIPVLKQDDIGFGPGWNLAGTERLVVTSSLSNPDKVYWIRSDGHVLTFDGINTRAPGDASASRLTYVDTNPSAKFYVLTDKHGTRSIFTAQLYKDFDGVDKITIGALEYKIDRFGNQTTYTYDDINNDGFAYEPVSWYNSATGQFRSFSYEDDQGSPTYHVQSITDETGRVTKLEYHPDSNRLISIELPHQDPQSQNPGPTTEYEYDSEGRLLWVIDQDNRKTNFRTEGESSAGRTVTVTHPDNTITTTITSRISPYADLLQLPLLKSVSVGGGGNKGYFSAVIKPGFSAILPSHVVTREGITIDALGRETEFKANSQGYILKTVDPTDRLTMYDRNSIGQPLRRQLFESTEEDAQLLNEGVYTYDGQFNLTDIQYFDGTSEHWIYDSKSRETSYTDELGRQTLTEYESHSSSNGEEFAKVRQIVGENDTDPLNTETDDIYVVYKFTTDGLLSRINEKVYDVDGTPLPDIESTFEYTAVSYESTGILASGRWLAKLTMLANRSPMSNMTCTAIPSMFAMVILP